MAGGDRDVVEETESHRLILEGMVPGRSHGAERVTNLALQNPVDRREDPPDRRDGGLVGFLGNGHVRGVDLPDLVAQTLAGLADALDILGAVYPPNRLQG